MGGEGATSGLRRSLSASPTPPFRSRDRGRKGDAKAILSRRGKGHVRSSLVRGPLEMQSACSQQRRRGHASPLRWKEERMGEEEEELLRPSRRRRGSPGGRREGRTREGAGQSRPSDLGSKSRRTWLKERAEWLEEGASSFFLSRGIGGKCSEKCRAGRQWVRSLSVRAAAAVCGSSLQQQSAAAVCSRSRLQQQSSRPAKKIKGKNEKKNKTKKQ